jgi:dTDP-glucose 4,6-dehydratase/UDP-glucose 4-epimerase
MIAINNGGEMDLISFPNNRKVIDIGNYYSNFSLISTELGWVPKVKLNDGLKKTIDFYKMHNSNYWNTSN